MTDIASLTRVEAEERAALIDVRRYDIAVDMRGLFEGETLETTSTISSAAGSPAPPRSSTASPRSAARPSTAGRSTRRPWTRGRLPLPDLAADNVLVVTATQSDTAQRVGHPAHRRRLRQARLRLDVLRAGRRPPGLGLLRPARPQGAARVHRLRPRDLDGHQQRRARRGRGRPRRRPPVDVPRHAAAVDVRRGGQRRPVPRDPGRARRPQPRPLLPAVAAAVPRAGRRGAVHPHRAGAGVLRRAVRPAVPAGALRPGVRAEHGRRHGELGLRHLERHRALPQRARRTASGPGGPPCCCTRWRTCGSATW